MISVDGGKDNTALQATVAPSTRRSQEEKVYDIQDLSCRLPTCIVGSSIRTEAPSDRDVVANGLAECGVDENSGKSVVGELVGTDPAHKKTHALLCQEYLLKSETVIYRIRPRMKSIPFCCRWAKKPSSVFRRKKCCCKWKMGIARSGNTAWFP